MDGVAPDEVATSLGDSEKTVETVYGKHAPDYLYRAVKSLNFIKKEVRNITDVMFFRQIFARGNRLNLCRKWSGRRGSNSRPRPWQGRALPLSYARVSKKWEYTTPATVCKPRLTSRFSLLFPFVFAH